MAVYTREQVKKVVIKLFNEDYYQEIMDILDLYGCEPYEAERERVQLAIIKLSLGDLNKLSHYCTIAKKDYRDVIYWAEYTIDAIQIPDPYRDLLEES